ncbi:hypothetical protein P7H50_06400 [Enterococcus durans]|uniref:hypothetical protein n=1 Tax=Enterococcus TaxID=1350 RepID=UPI00288D49C4|nr:hypothetical protein [Enterococcus durans]MDT2836516.1 hypothetical protein [Enterococcus durans]
MEKKVKREDVANLLIKDKYFSKGNNWLKLKQTIIAIIGWGAVVFPFIWVGLSINTSIKGEGLRIHYFSEERQTFYFLLLLLSIVFVVFIVVFLLMTRWNNRRYKKMLRSEKMYDEQKLEKRQGVLEKEYTQRFGPKEEREAVCYYVVSEEQNLEKDLIKNLYEKEGVGL